MNYVRKVTNSDVLANVIDLPKELKNRKVEIIIIPYDNSHGVVQKNMKGALAKYKNQALQVNENEAWPSAVVEKDENS